MSYRIGVDIGGTFADFCALDETTGRLATLKVLSTPQEPGREVITGLAELGSRFGIQPADIGYFTHGTTVGINSVIQRKGIRLCLFTTENFVDVLELARLKMPDPYHLMSSRAEPLITRDRVLAVRERMLADGTVDKPLDQASLRQRARPGDGARRRRDRAGAAAFLSQSGARARGRAADRPVGAEDARVLLQRRVADHPRVRAHRHGHDPRLRAAAGGALPDGPAGAP